MKAFLWVVVIGAVVVGGFFYLSDRMVSDQGRQIAFAYGFPREGAIEMHVAVYRPMTTQDPPRVDLKSGHWYWDEWLDEHLVVTDKQTGQQVSLKKMNNSSLIQERDIGGTPEFYAVGELKQNAAYTFDFIPIAADPLRYRHEFTAPAEEQKARRANFKPFQP